MRTSRFVFVALLSVAIALPAGAQQTPSEFHGYELGSRFTIFESMHAYYQHLDAASERVVYEDYGRSVHGRPLPLIWVSNEANLRDRESIREATLTLSRRTEALPEAELEALIGDTPAIAWIFILDSGNENVGPEVVQELVYDLATREDETARRIRENLVVAFAPMTNPDAQVRYVNWHKIYNVVGSSADPRAVQNSPHWGISSDGNAFGIDMNRDFTWFTIPETQALARFAVHWQPASVLDLHTGPNTFFMTPTGPPYHPMWPDENLKWSWSVVERAADRFAQRGWLLSTGVQYAGITYLGHGLTWALMGPSVTGQFVESFGGVNPERPRPDGTVATLRGGMDRTALATWAHLETLTERKEELLRDSYEIAVRSARESAERPVRSVVIPAPGAEADPAKVRRLVDRLAMQGIELRRASESFSANAASFFDPENASGREFPAGSFVVDLVQPYSRMARALLDPTNQYGPPEIDPVFGRTSPFYDAQVENLPFLFGVPAYTATGVIEVAGELHREGEGWGEAGVVAVDPAAYGYLMPPGREASSQIAVHLMRDGYRMRVARAPFRIAGVDHPEGTWVTLRDRNPEGLGERLGELASRFGGEVIPVSGSLTEAGVTLANPSLIAEVPEARIAVLADYPVSFDHVWGGVRNTLEWDLELPFTPVLMSTLNGADLSSYSTVVLPHGQGYGSRLDLDNLRSFVQGGGTVVAMKGAAEALAADATLGRGVTPEGRGGFIFGATMRAQWHDDDPVAPGHRMEWRPGIRVGQPLVSAGLSREFAAPANQPVLFEVDEATGAQVLASYSGDAARIMLDGYVWEPELESVVGRALVVRRPVGSGQVIYMSEDITYRGKWYGMNLVFLNALLLGPVG